MIVEVNSITELRNVLKSKTFSFKITEAELGDKVLKFKNIQELSVGDILSAMISMGKHVDTITPLLGIDRVLLLSLHADYDLDVHESSDVAEDQENTNPITLKLREKAN